MLQEALTRSFVLHYSRIPTMLEESTAPDLLSNRVVHVSVQLFSNEGLALRMTEQLSLLHVMVLSLKYMMSKILIPNTLHSKSFISNKSLSTSEDWYVAIPSIEKIDYACPLFA